MKKHTFTKIFRGINMKNIVIVGVLDVYGSSNIWMASAFKQAGYNVIPVNYRIIIGKYNRTFFREYLLHVVKEYKPELTIFCKCNGVEPPTIAECSQYSKTWLFFMDSFKQLEACPEVVESAKNCHISSATSVITVEFMKQNGAKNCIHMFEGTDNILHRIVEPVDKYLATISFVGTRTDERDKYKNILEYNLGKENVKFYGYGYSEKLVIEDWSAVCASSKYMLSMNTYNNLPTYFSGRVFELLGSGACVFHYDNTNTLEQYFKHGIDLFYFGTEEDLLNLVRNTTDEQEISVRANGYKKVSKNHTWNSRVRKMMEIASADSSILG